MRRFAFGLVFTMAVGLAVPAFAGELAVLFTGDMQGHVQPCPS